MMQQHVAKKQVVDYDMPEFLVDSRVITADQLQSKHQQQLLPQPSSSVATATMSSTSSSSSLIQNQTNLSAQYSQPPLTMFPPSPPIATTTIDIIKNESFVESKANDVSIAESGAVLTIDTNSNNNIAVGMDATNEIDQLDDIDWEEDN
jgi:hypothetical protein